MAPRVPQERPKSAPRAPKSAPRASKSAPRTPKSAPRAPKIAPRAHKHQKTRGNAQNLAKTHKNEQTHTKHTQKHMRTHKSIQYCIRSIARANYGHRRCTTTLCKHMKSYAKTSYNLYSHTKPCKKYKNENQREIKMPKPHTSQSQTQSHSQRKAKQEQKQKRPKSGLEQPQCAPSAQKYTKISQNLAKTLKNIEDVCRNA